MKITKRLFFVAMLALSFSAFSDDKVIPPTPLDAEYIQRDIAVAAKSDADYETVLNRRELLGAKLCNTFNAPGKNVEIQATITNQAGETVWVGSVTKNCTALDNLPEPIDLGEYGFINIKCRNFDAVDRVCRAKAVIYSK